MHESAISNGHRPGSTAPPSEQFPRPQQLVDAERVVAGALTSTEQLIDRIDARFMAVAEPRAARHRKSKLAQFHQALIYASGCSAIFVLGVLMGLQVAR